MVEPVKRNAYETMEEVGYGTIKGAGAGLGVLALGVLAAAAIGATLFAVAAIAAPTILAGVVGAILPASIGTWGTSAGAMAATSAFMSSYTIGGVVTGLAATAGGLLAGGGAAVGLSSGMSVFAGIGALLGTMRSANKVGKENAAFVAKAREPLMAHEKAIVDARNEAMQMGFQAGAEQGRAIGQQEGAQMVMAKLQEHAQHEQHAAPAQHGHTHPHHEEGQKGKSFAAAIAGEREKAAVAGAGAQIG